MKMQRSHSTGKHDKKAASSSANAKTVSLMSLDIVHELSVLNFFLL